MITYYLIEAIDWLNPIVSIVGLIVSIWAFRKFRKKGYILISAYFAIAAFNLLAVPKINQAIAEKQPPAIPQKTQERIDQEIAEVYVRNFEEGTFPAAATRNINFPLGPILLVTGLWLVAKKENNAEPVT